MLQTFSFNKETIYHAKGEKKVCVTEIDKTKYDDVMPGQTTSWDDEEFEVPSVTPPCLEGCKIINIDHYLRVNVLKQYHNTAAFCGKIYLVVCYFLETYTCKCIHFFQNGSVLKGRVGRGLICVRFLWK